MRSTRPILLVEDDNVDVMTVKRVFKDLKVTNPLVHSINGEEALEYLRDEGNEKPCIVILNLNMPKMNGIEFLKVLKGDKVLRKIPAVVLTASKNEHDIVESFKLGVAGYMVKEVDYKKFAELISAINLYWTFSELPNQE
jgi:CheY-like chemotaxis protein